MDRAKALLPELCKIWAVSKGDKEDHGWDPDTDDPKIDISRSFKTGHQKGRSLLTRQFLASIVGDLRRRTSGTFVASTRSKE